MLVCVACKNGSIRRLGLKNSLPVGRCRSCGNIVADVCSEADADLYESYYQATLPQEAPGVGVSLRRLVRSLDQFRVSSRWLDVGFGAGALLRTAAADGWECYGTEKSRIALEYAKSQGWKVTDRVNCRSALPAGHFDVVTLIEVLEHLSNPFDMLGNAAHWLRRGGALYITTPNAASLNRRLLGIEWSVISPPEHLTLWQSKSLCKTLRNAGFEVRRVVTEGFNPYELFTNWRFGRKSGGSGNRTDMGQALNEIMLSSGVCLAMKRGINLFLRQLQIGDTLKLLAVKV